MKSAINIKNFIENQKILNITTGDEKDYVLSCLGEPTSVSKIYNKLGMHILAYGNFIITCYAGKVVGLAIDLVSADRLLVFDLESTFALKSDENLLEYLEKYSIKSETHDDSIFPYSSLAFFSIEEGRVVRLGLRDALIHGYVKS